MSWACWASGTDVVADFAQRLFFKVRKLKEHLGRCKPITKMKHADDNLAKLQTNSVEGQQSKALRYELPPLPRLDLRVQHLSGQNEDYRLPNCCFSFNTVSFLAALLYHNVTWSWLELLK